MTVQDWFVGVLLCAFHVVTCFGWTYEDYPNPQTNPHMCGRSSAGWVCDPEGLLTTKQADDVNSELQKIRDLPNVCICELCPSSINIAVALIDRVVFTYKRTKKTRQEQKEYAVFAFAHSLRIHRYRFQGECLNDAMIFGTREGEIDFAIGRNANYKVSWGCRIHIEKIGKEHFTSEQYYEGLMKMTKTLRTSLEGGSCGDDTSSPSGQSSVLVVVGATVGGVVVICVYCIVVYYVRRKRATQMNSTTAQKRARYHPASQGGATVVVGAPPPHAYNEAYPAAYPPANPHYHKLAY